MSTHQHDPRTASEPPYQVNYSDTDELDAYVEKVAEKRGLHAAPYCDFDRTYILDNDRWDGKLRILRVEGEGDYWESAGVHGENLDEVLKAVLKKSEDEKRQLTFTVTLELDAEVTDDPQHFNQAATALAEYVVKSWKRLALSGTNVERVTVSVEGDSVTKAAPKK